MANPDERNPASGPGFEGQHATGQAQANGNASRTNPLSQPDFNDAQNFLDLIGPTASTYCFRTFKDAKDAPTDKGHKFHGTLASVATALENDNRSKRGTFAVINEGGDTDDSITSIRAVFADTDGAPLDPIMRCGLDPHAVVETSPGKWHCYWRVTGLEVDQFRGVQRRIAYQFGTDRKVINPSRVMRLPGFDHHKGEAFRVHTIHESGLPAYTAEQVLAAFPPLAKLLRSATKAERDLMMTTDERAALAAMPEEITVYRGCYEINRRGLSWTTDINIAARFPTLHRYSRPGEQPILLQAIAYRDRAVAKHGRSEDEVIVVDAHQVEEVAYASA